MSIPRLATISFAVGFAVATAVLAGLGAPTRAALAASRSPAGEASHVPASVPPQPIVATPVRSGSPAPKSKPALTDGSAASRRERSTHRAKRRATSRAASTDRWSKAAFAAKRARSRLVSAK